MHKRYLFILSSSVLIAFAVIFMNLFKLNGTPVQSFLFLLSAPFIGYVLLHEFELSRFPNYVLLVLVFSAFIFSAFKSGLELLIIASFTTPFAIMMLVPLLEQYRTVIFKKNR
ncbi:hypothetical protein KAW38_00285 [Candidatus Micrarchaeota archaeon]|nr:hypothetical protein [Candidatus Micrarchaeota archaeon]